MATFKCTPYFFFIYFGQSCGSFHGHVAKLHCACRDAAKAVEDMNGSEYSGERLRVEISRWAPGLECRLHVGYI